MTHSTGCSTSSAPSNPPRATTLQDAGDVAGHPSTRPAGLEVEWPQRIRSKRETLGTLAQEIDKGVRKMGQDLERALNGLTSSYQGRPVAEVKSAVARMWTRVIDGGLIEDPELTQYGGRPSVGGVDRGQAPGSARLARS